MTKARKVMPIKNFGSTLGIETQEFAVSAFQQVSTTYNIFLQDSIVSPEDFQSAITALRMAEEHDNVNIFLSSNGGSIDAGLTLISEMRKCRAPIHIVASGTVASMGVFILLAADSFEMEDWTSIMIHSASFGYSGQVTDVVAYSAFVKKQTDGMFRQYFEGFLTEDEIISVLEHKKEWWMDAEEFCDRFESRQKFLEAEHEKFAKENNQGGCNNCSSCSCNDEIDEDTDFSDVPDEDLLGIVEALQAEISRRNAAIPEDTNDEHESL